MLKQLMVTTALSGVLIGAAFAEGTPAGQTGSPPAAQSQTTPSDAAKPADAAKPSEASKPAGASSAKFINSQKSDQFLASNFKGTDVIGADDKKIGDISDILFDKSGKIEAYVVSVGGFLGIGSKHVAIEPSAFQVVSGDKSKNESDKLKVSLNEEQLKQAANFEPYKPPQTTTGMGGGAGGGTRAPAGAPR
jgi:hypothetical protein